MTTDEEILLEELSDIEHKQWMYWSKSIHTKLDRNSYKGAAAFLKTGWSPNWVDYRFLADEVKEHDRKWARIILAIIEREKKLAREAGENTTCEHAREGLETAGRDIKKLLLEKEEKEIQKLKDLELVAKAQDNAWGKVVLKEQEKNKKLRDALKEIVTWTGGYSFPDVGYCEACRALTKIAKKALETEGKE